MQQTATAGGGTSNPSPNMINMAAAPGVGNGGPQDPNAMAAAMSVMAAAQAAQGGAAAAGGIGTMPNQVAPGGVAGGMAGGAGGNFFNPAFAGQTQDHNAQTQDHNAAAAAHAAAAMAERNLSTAASRSMGGNGRNSWVQVDGNNALPGSSIPDAASNPGNSNTFQATSAEAAIMMNQQQQQRRLMETFHQQQANLATSTGANTDPTSQLILNPYGQQYNSAMQTPQPQATAVGGTPTNISGMTPQQTFQQPQQPQAAVAANMNPYGAASNPNAALLGSLANPAAAATNVPPASYSPLAMLGLNIPPQHMTTANAFGLATASLPQPPMSIASKKKVQRKKNKNKPKRPLSAYNLFFKDERAKILKGIPDADTNDDINGQPQSSGENEDKIKREDDDNEDVSRGANADNNRDKGGAKEEELKGKNATSSKKQKVPHGKIGFENLAKLIGKRWQNLDPKRVEYYKELADKDMKRYKDEMEAFLTKQEMDLAKEKKEMQESNDGNNNAGGGSSTKSSKRKTPDSASQSNGMMPTTTMPMVAPGGVGMGPGFELFGLNNLQQMKDHWERTQQQQHLQLQIQQQTQQLQNIANEVALGKKRRLDANTNQSEASTSNIDSSSSSQQK